MATPRVRKICGTKRTPPCPPRTAPFGGPATSAWSFGNGGGNRPSCKGANLFSECFKGCSAPGNCGWTTVIGISTFNGQNVQVDPVTGFGVIYKPFVGPAANVTLQAKFQEINAPPTGAMNYAVGYLDAAGVPINAVLLFGDGTLNVFAAGIIYSGSWSPQAGAVHTVHLTVASNGAPSLSIDQIGIPLTLGGVAPPMPPFGNAAVFSVQNPAPDGPSTLFAMFIVSGVFPPNSIFCCPNGQPLS